MKAFFIGLIIFALLSLLNWYAHSETYFLVYPSIDTVYAPSFNDRNFEAITVGASKEHVLSELGNPLEVKQLGYECWMYSRDRNLVDIFDFAWISVGVCFRDDRVVIRFRNVLSL